MTTEEKATKYDEALEWMRKVYPTLTGADKEDAEHYFPEVTKSKNEQIKEALISFLHEMENSGGVASFNGFSIKEYNTYLEKQKDPDGIWTEEDDAKVRVMCKEGDLKPSERAWLKELKNRIVKKEQKESSIKWLKSDNLKNPDKPYIDKAGMFYTTDGRMCYASEIEKQKEQKLTNEYQNWELIHEFVEKFGRIPKDEDELNALVDYVLKRQKPVEWSEGDEKMRTKILEALDAYADHVQYTGFCINSELIRNELMGWLKSLNPQPKQEQKPETKLTGWVARDSEYNPYSGLGLILFNEKPRKYYDCWRGAIASQLPWESFPDLKWEDEPMKVEVTIRKK